MNRKIELNRKFVDDNVKKYISNSIFSVGKDAFAFGREALLIRYFSDCITPHSFGNKVNPVCFLSNQIGFI